MKKRFIKVIVITGLVLFVIGAIAFVGRIFPRFFVCPVRRFLHLSCPGCGMTSAVSALLKLDFKTAFLQNMMFLPILAYIFYVFLSYAINYIKNGEKNLYPKPEWLNVSFLAIIVIWTIVRNIFHI